MSNYSGGRRAPNVSEYIANLNSVPTEEELAVQSQDHFADLDSDLALFTNTEFFDFDIGAIAGMSQNSGIDSTADERLRGQQTSPYETSPSSASFSKPDFHFPDFRFQPANLPDARQLDIQPAQARASPLTGSSTASASPISRHHGPQSGDKRKMDFVREGSNGNVMEETSRVAAEEDKRRRNTAASARFRVKKKQREQALEKSAKDMTDKVSLLESRVQQLEVENRWLKGLITEKNDEVDFDKMLKGSRAVDKSRKPEERKDGVGTSD